MWKGVLVAYFIVALCYFPVALIGYRMFGNKIEDNIFLSLEKPAWLISAANMFYGYPCCWKYRFSFIAYLPGFHHFHPLEG